MVRKTLISAAVATVLVSAALLLLPTATFAADITVTTVLDEADFGTGNGYCSLREAMLNVQNQNQGQVDCPTGAGGPHKIVVGPGTYNLTITAAGGYNLPPISVAVEIAGAGPDQTIINGDPTHGQVFKVSGGPGTGEIIIAGMTIQGGRGGYGGGIEDWLQAPSTLILREVVIRNNVAGCGGGGLAVRADGNVTVQRSRFVNNTAGAGCGESFYHGGGIYNTGAMRVIDSTVRGNRAPKGNGGGIENTGTLLLINTTVSGNLAAGSGGGLDNFRKVPVTTRSGDSSEVGAAVLENSTISGNAAGKGGGGISNVGSASLKLTHSTVANNTGGGIVNETGDILLGPTVNGPVPIVRLENSIVARQAKGPDCWGKPLVTSGGGNLDSDNTCNLIAPGDKPGEQTPRLGPLQDNGGPTWTHALLNGSPAIDAANLDFCLPTDQRGVFRPQGPACDMGAFEAEVVDLQITKYASDLQPSNGGGSGKLPNPVQPPPIVTIAGGELFYQVWVYNNSKGTAHNVVVRDTLPPGVSYLADTDACTVIDAGPPQQVLRCELGDLGPYEQQSFWIKARVAAGLVVDTPGGEDGAIDITNVAVVSSDNPEIDLENNRAEVTSFVQESADLEVTKVGKPDGEVRAGQWLEYTIYVDNHGPSAARNLVLTDDLLISGTNLTVQNLPAKCTEAPDRHIICNLAVLAAGARAEMRFNVSSDETQDVNNLVKVQADTPDPDTSNNQAMTMTSFTDVADLSIVKEGPEVPCIEGLEECVPTAGWPVTYRLAVENHGPSTAENVVVEDQLPAGVQLIEVRSSQGSCDAGFPGDPGAPLTCGLGELAFEGTATVEVEVMIDADLPLDFFTIYLGELCDSARVRSDTFDENSGNDRSHLCHPVMDVANLSVIAADAAPGRAPLGGAAKPETPDPVLVGETVTYPIVVVNGGPSQARDVRLFDILPAGTTYHSDTLPGVGSCEISPIEYNLDGYPLIPAGALRCDLGDLGPGEVEEFSISLWVDSDVADSTVLRNMVVGVSMEVLDPIPADNVSVVETLALTQADVAVSKDGQPAEVYAGESILYTLRVENHGPSDAQNVTVADTLPGRVDYRIDNAGCELLSENPDVLSCNVGTLRPGESREIEVWGWVDFHTQQNEVLENEACVTSETTLGDPNPENDCATAENLVQRKVDLKIRKFGKPDGEVRAGENLTYTLVVDNLGPSDAHAVDVWDLLQSSGTFELVSIASDRPATCTPESGTFVERLELNCSLLEQLPVRSSDESGRWLITVVVRADQTQDINNLAEVVSGAVLDPDPDNNSAYAEHEITDVADLNTSKCVWPDPDKPEHDCGDGPVDVVAGTEVKYRAYITNDGPSTAENVVLVDRLPRGMEVVSIEHNGFDCALTQPSAGDTVLECGYPNLAAGGQKYVDYVVRVDPNVPHGAVLANGAYSWSSIYDPDAFNDYDEILVRVNVENELWFGKEASANPALAGGLLEYTLLAGNDGPSTAWDAFVWDGLPEEVELVTVEAVNWPGAMCSYSAGLHEVMCYLGEVEPGATVKVQVLTRVRADTPGGESLHNAAEIWSRHDVASASVTTQVRTEADLAVFKTAKPEKVYAGEQQLYTLQVRNEGPSAARNVVLLDELPWQVQGEIAPDSCYEAAPGVVGCDLGLVMPGEEREVAVWVQVKPSAAPDTQLRNEACVTGQTSGGDPNPGNDCSTARSLVLGKADLKIVKFGKPDGEVRAGENMTYTVIVDNLGPGFAHDVVVDDLLQSSGRFELVAVESDRLADCAPLPGTFNQRLELRCELADALEVRTPEATGRWLLTVVVRADEAQSINNVAWVMGSDYDPDLTNNEAYVEGGVTEMADLEVTKTSVGLATGPGGVLTEQANKVAAGQSMTYTLTVTNHGPSRAEHVELYDWMPEVIEVSQIAASQGSCHVGMPGDPPQKMTCYLDTLAAGGSATVVVSAYVPQEVPEGTVLRNDATVGSDMPDLVHSNNFVTNLTVVNHWKIYLPLGQNVSTGQ